jgi:hypothetical protein
MAITKQISRNPKRNRDPNETECSAETIWIKGVLNALSEFAHLAWMFTARILGFVAPENYALRTCAQIASKVVPGHLFRAPDHAPISFRVWTYTLFVAKIATELHKGIAIGNLAKIARKNIASRVSSHNSLLSILW